MISEQPQTRLESVAQEVVDTVARPAKLLSVLLQGSVARGAADAYSDIELMLIWSEEVTADERSRVFCELDKQALFPEEQEDGEWYYSFTYKGVKIDICHVEIALLRQTASDVMNVRTTSIASQTLLASIQDARPLFGEDVFRELIDSLSDYPEVLADRCVLVNASFQEWSMRYALSERQDVIALHHLVDMTTLQMLRLLFAANRVYLRSYNFKWMTSQLALLPRKPERLEQRLMQVLSAGDDQLAELDALLHETLGLARELHPNLDLVQAAKTLDYVRQKI